MTPSRSRIFFAFVYHSWEVEHIIPLLSGIQIVTVVIRPFTPTFQGSFECPPNEEKPARKAGLYPGAKCALLLVARRRALRQGNP